MAGALFKSFSFSLGNSTNKGKIFQLPATNSALQLNYVDNRAFYLEYIPLQNYVNVLHHIIIANIVAQVSYKEAKSYRLRK